MKSAIIFFLAVSALFAQAGAWTGRLIDADCHQRQPESPCPAKTTSAQYAVLLPGGTVFPIAAASAARVRRLIENQPGELTVLIGGRLQGGAIAVDNLSVTAASAVPPKPAPKPAARCDLRLPGGACYEISVPANARIQRLRSQRRAPGRVVITGTLEGNTVRVESVTIR